MKFLIIILLLIGSSSCDSAGKNESTADEVPSSNTSSDQTPQEGLNPGEITFTIKVLETYSTARDICGISKENVSLVEVMKVSEGGAGATNLPKKTDELLVAFLSPSTGLKEGVSLEAKAKESLCPDASKTYYTIKSYEIIE